MNATIYRAFVDELEKQGSLRQRLTSWKHAKKHSPVLRRLKALHKEIYGSPPSPHLADEQAGNRLYDKIVRDAKRKEVRTLKTALKKE